MATMKQHKLLPPSWNRASRLRQEKIAKRLADNGSKAKNVDIDAIRARRARLEELTKAMKGPGNDKRSSSMVPSGRKDVRLAPIGTPSPNQLDKKRREDALLLKKPKPSERSDSGSSTKYEEELMEKWRKSRLMGDDQRRSSIRDETDSDEEPLRKEREAQKGKQDKEEEEEDEEEDDDDDDNEEKDEEEEDEDEEDDDEDNNDSDGSEKTGDGRSKAPHIEEPNEKSVRDIIRQIKARTEDERLVGVYKARKHLSVENNPPFDLYVDAGVVPPLVSCLSSYNPTLQFEAAWTLTNLASGSTEHSMALYEGGAIPELIILLSSPYNRVSDQCVWAIGNLAGDSTFLWQMVIDEGVIKPLYNLIEKSPSLSSLRNLSWTFSNILRHKPLNLSHSDFTLCLKAVRLFLHHPDKEIHLNACWSLVYITDNGNDKIEEVLKAGVLPRIVEELLDTNDKKTLTPAVRTLGNIMTGSDEQTGQVVNTGAIPPLVRHLDHSSSNIRKDCCWALSNIMAGTEAQIQNAIDNDALSQLAVIISKDEPRVKKEAIWCVSNLTQSGNQGQIDEAVKNDLLANMADSTNHKNAGVDKQQMHVALEGINNMLKKCSNPDEAARIILEHLSLKKLEKLTYDDDKEIAAVSANLHLTLSEYSDDS